MSTARIYATYAQFRARYETRLSEHDLETHYLPYASARLDAMLGLHFPLPFAEENITARDLTIDLAYLLILQRYREEGPLEALRASIRERTNALIEGQEGMRLQDGSLLRSQAPQRVWGKPAQRASVWDEPHRVVSMRTHARRSSGSA